MCGIFGINSYHDIIRNLLDGLSSLEYRGYDSAGISVINSGTLLTVKTPGRVSSLKVEVINKSISGNIGIAHTRWATHGSPSTENAHPHSNNKVSVAHNGIVENYYQLKEELLKEKVEFSSETDTEVILHLIQKYMDLGHTPLTAVVRTINRLKGSFAIIVLFHDFPDIIIGAAHHSPLVIGYGNGENYISSDTYALTKFTDTVSYLEDGDIVLLQKDKVEIFDSSGKKPERFKHKINKQVSNYDKGHFQHYMLKEIYEQPIAIKRVLETYFTKERSLKLPEFDYSNIEHIYIIACGTSYFAGMVAKYWFEELANIPTSVEISSEFRYRKFIPIKNSVAIFISQSGETADTIAALKLFKDSAKSRSIGVINVVASTIGRAVDLVLPIHADQEIGVASTKAFTNQLLVLCAFALKLSLEKKVISSKQVQTNIEALLELPGRISELLDHEPEYKSIAKLIKNAKSILYIGRGIAYPIALEGSLKLKEISYIHAEAIAAGELKHGPIALISSDMYVIVIAPSDKIFDKSLSNIRSVLSRSGKIILLSTSEGIDLVGKENCASVVVNQSSVELLNPFLYLIPLQLIAYNVGVLRNCDVDKPRNLAKAVTVE